MLKRPDYKPIETNLIGSIYAIQLFAHYVGKRKNYNGGKIVLTSSGAGQFGMPSHPVYCASKHGVSSLLVSQFHIDLMVYKGYWTYEGTWTNV